MTCLCNAFLLLALLIPGQSIAAGMPHPELVWEKLADADGVLNKDTEETSVENAEFSPDETMIASAAKGDDTVRLWTVDGKELWRFRAAAEVECLAFTRDGQFVLAGGDDACVHVLRATDGHEVLRLPLRAAVEGMRLSPDGKLLAAGTEAGEVVIWDLAAADPSFWPKQPVATWRHGYDADADPALDKTKQSDVNQLDWSPDGKWLYTGGRNALVHRWKITQPPTAANTPERSYTGHQGSIKSVRVSPDGSLIAAGAQASPDGAVRVWETATGREVLAQSFPSMRIMETVLFSPDGLWLLAGGDANGRADFGRLLVYRVSDLGQPPASPAREIPMFSQEYLAMSRDSRLLLIAHNDGGLRLWRWLP